MVSSLILLDAQRMSQNCAISADSFQQVVLPSSVDGQRAPGLRFGDPRVMALFSSLCQFCHLPDGFTNATLASLGRRSSRPAPLQRTPDDL